MAPALSLIAATALVLVWQPDLGMALLVCAIFATQLFVAGLAWGWVALALLAGLAGIWGAYHGLPHVRERIDGFFGPVAEFDQVGTAMKALASGGLFGRGPGEGVVKFSLPRPIPISSSSPRPRSSASSSAC